ncbi:VOC family protein [Enterococcus rivorum]|uniref:Glyoxalase n=1 Tax=Enterococcus rivorum TaxID=762845 RepID=A0A1E5KXL8_9ENTE|nr:VOC family protein [Enterococcus rivorum]MBP2099493.1 putative lactoylglutathione lyase [Enterococcus rivorum]OEH82606.1 glyoxalase [Enterococcus rivorum]
MMDHFSIHVWEIEKSKQFCTEALMPLGNEIKMDFGTAVSFGKKNSNGGDPAGSFWLTEGEPKHIHFAFSASSREEVDAFYLAAIQAGGISNGTPGIRSDYHENYYATFIIDLDGYNIEAVYHGQ